MGRATILYDDKVAAATLSGTAPAGGLPLANLQDPQPTKVARWSATTAFVVADLGATFSIGLVALGGTNLSTSATRRVRLSTVDTTGAAGDAHDSGTAAAGADPRYNGTVLHVLSANVSARYVRVDVTDATLSFIDAGLFLAGPAFRPTRNYSFGATFGYQDAGGAEQSPVGKLFVNRRGRKRVATLRFAFASEAEAMVDHMELSRIAGATENVVIVPDPVGTYVAAQSLIGLVEDVTEIRNEAFNVWSRTITVVERV
jgi:hypothetical protein